MILEIIVGAIIFICIMTDFPHHELNTWRDYLRHRRKMAAIDKIHTLRALGESDEKLEEHLKSLAE